LIKRLPDALVGNAAAALLSAAIISTIWRRRATRPA
jgi:hypothetical protein